MLKVNKDDYILIPNLPQRGQITIAEATEDWNTGYEFSVLPETGDHGHIFPANSKLNFHGSNGKIPASLRGAFRNPCRFWNITHLQKDIEDVLKLPKQDLESTSSIIDRWRLKIESIIGENGLQKRLFEEAQSKFGKHEWEYLLVNVLQRLNPGWKVKRTGGTTEAKHGTDILVRIPDVFRYKDYGIAIQVKDYKDIVSDSPVDQISKAGDYWDERGINILEHVVVVIRAEKDANPQVTKYAEEAGVRLIWSSDVEELVFRSACHYISDPDRQIPSLETPEDASE